MNPPLQLETFFFNWRLFNTPFSEIAFQVVLGEKNLLDNAGERRDMGLIPGSGGSPGEGNGNYSSILA